MVDKLKSTNNYSQLHVLLFEFILNKLHLN